MIYKTVTHNNNYVAIVKAIGIILMVCGHSGCWDFLYKFIALFHMPVFFFCSGYFFNAPSSFPDCKLFVYKRIKGLYWPYIKWSLLFLILHNFLWHCSLYDHLTVELYTFPDILNRVGHIMVTMTGHDQLLDGFWFLKQLLLASVANCLILFLLNRWRWKGKHLSLILFFLLCSIVSKFYNLGIPVIWDLSLVFLSMSYFCTGCFYKKIEHVETYSYFKIILCFIVLLLFVLMYNDNLDMLYYSYKSLFYYFLISLCGIYMVFNIAFILEKSILNSFLYYIGNNTMIILILHLSMFKIGNFAKILLYNLPISKIADYKIIREYNDYYWIFYVIIGVFFSLLIGKVIETLKYYLRRLSKTLAI